MSIIYVIDTLLSNLHKCIIMSMNGSLVGWLCAWWRIRIVCYWLQHLTCINEIFVATSSPAAAADGRMRRRLLLPMPSLAAEAGVMETIPWWGWCGQRGCCCLEPHQLRIQQLVRCIGASCPVAASLMLARVGCHPPIRSNDNRSNENNSRRRYNSHNKGMRDNSYNKGNRTNGLFHTLSDNPSAAASYPSFVVWHLFSSSRVLDLGLQQGISMIHASTKVTRAN